MEAEVTRVEISELPLTAMTAFATGCTRIAYEGLKRRRLPTTLQDLEGVLLEVDRLGKLAPVWLEEKTKLVGAA